MSEAIVTRIEDGVYRVVLGGQTAIVYVAGQTGERWAWWNGQVFREAAPEARERGEHSRIAPPHGRQSLSAPMPATVRKILVTPGTIVRKGDMLLILEAMKMEWPLRALDDATVTAVHCREGELVQPDAVLVETS